MQLNKTIALFFKGMAMGIAEVIPGVSGGTIAFITGIYEQLLESIKAVLGRTVLDAFREGGFSAAFRAIHGGFLLRLVGGMVFGVITGVFGVSHLLARFPEVLWSFFFGLIVASSLYLAKKVGRWKLPQIGIFVFFTVLAYVYTVAAPSEGTQVWWFVILSGAIAISALMLPGISGSFMLVLLGMYGYIIESLKNVLGAFSSESLLVVLLFGVGCLIGLATFSRVLTWTFKHHYTNTMAGLTGFMIGSLNKIWPWREVITWRLNSKGEQTPLLERSVSPLSYQGDPMLLSCVIAAIVGFLLVFLLDKYLEQTGGDQ
jgi:putative membrane protein